MTILVAQLPPFSRHIIPLKVEIFFSEPCEISSSHGGEYEAQNLLGCTAVFLTECPHSIKNKAIHPRRF
jgi:hypothetical protein